jgi:hypothetical protein
MCRMVNDGCVHLIVVIIIQYIWVSNHHVVYLEYIQSLSNIFKENIVKWSLRKSMQGLTKK